MTLYEIKLALCQLAYDLTYSKTWKQFDDYVLRYGVNIFCDSVFSDGFYSSIETKLTHKQLFELMSTLFERYERYEVVEIIHSIPGTREYHTLLSDMMNNCVVGL